MVRKADGTRGNTKQDADWLQEHEKELVPTDPALLIQIPAAARMQWTGRKEDEGSPWQIPPIDRRCKAKAYVRDGDGQWVLDRDGQRLRRPCTSWPVLGAEVCTHHGGGVPVVKAAAMERLAAAADSMVSVLITIAQDENAADSNRITAAKDVLDRLGLRASSEVSVSIRPYETLLQKWADEGIGPDSAEEDE